MNPWTGEIKDTNELTPEQKATEGWHELDRRPDPGCKKCYGRGYVGRDAMTGRVILCKCVKRRQREIKERK